MADYSEALKMVSVHGQHYKVSAIVNSMITNLNEGFSATGPQFAPQNWTKGAPSPAACPCSLSVPVSFPCYPSGRNVCSGLGGRGSGPGGCTVFPRK